MDWFKATSTGAQGFYSQIQASSDGSRWQPFKENTYRFLRTAGFLSPGSCFNSTGRARRCTAGWCQCRISVTVFLVGDLIPRIYTYTSPLYHHFLLLLSSAAAPAGLQVLPAPLGKVPKKVVLRQQPSGRAVLLQGGVGAPRCPRFLKMMGTDMIMMGWCLGRCFFLKSEHF